MSQKSKDKTNPHYPPNLPNPLQNRAAPDLQRPKVDQGPFNFGSGSAGETLYAGSVSGVTMSHASAADYDDDGRSHISAYSFRSEFDNSRFLRETGGRVFNALNETYFLPSDENEWARLNKQHLAFVLGLGGLYPAREVVNATLAPQEGTQKKVLDIGCGTGVWALDMARKFPHAEVVGIDLAPVPVETENLPSNCRFEIDDVQLGLTHFHGQFDVVQARLIVAGLKDFRKSMADIHACVKPGGIMLWFDAEYDLYTPDIHVCREVGSDASPTGSWMGRIVYEMVRAGTSMGRSDFAGMAEALDAGLWDNPLFDPETCKTASLYLPFGPWAKNENIALSQQLKYVGALFRQEMTEAHKGAQTLLAKAGWPATTIADWSRRADEELSTMQHPIQARFRLAWGRKRAAPDQLAPPLPDLPSPNSEEGEDYVSTSAKNTYPLYFEYDTKEQSLAEAEIRNRSKVFEIPPLPTPTA